MQRIQYVTITTNEVYGLEDGTTLTHTLRVFSAASTPRPLQQAHVPVGILELRKDTKLR